MTGWGVVGARVGLWVGDGVIGEGVVGTAHESWRLQGRPANTVRQHSYGVEKDWRRSADDSGYLPSFVLRFGGRGSIEPGKTTTMPA